NLDFDNRGQESNILSILSGAISNSLQDLGYENYQEDILKILQRDAFSSDIRLTTWIVDPTSIDNYGTGPGTGVIEFTNVDSFSAEISTGTSPSTASLNLVDPSRILNIYEEYIEVAITEAVLGTFGLFESVINGEVGIQNVDT